MNNGKLIFHNQPYRRTAPFGEWRDNGRRRHMGTDYSVLGYQYCPLNLGRVHRIVNVEDKGNPRGLYVEVRWDKYDLGLIVQHAKRVMVAPGQIVGVDTPLVETGMTGLDVTGRRVSTGIHAHVELFRISTGVRMDFETFDFEEVIELLKDLKVQVIETDGTKHEETVKVVERENVNYIMARECDTVLKLCEVSYDATAKQVVIKKQKGKSNAKASSTRRNPKGH